MVKQNVITWSYVLFVVLIKQIRREIMGNKGLIMVLGWVMVVRVLGWVMVVSLLTSLLFVIFDNQIKEV